MRKLYRFSFISLITSALAVQVLSGQSLDRNFGSLSIPLVPVVSDSMHTLPDSLKRTRIRYFDGLGRFLQSVGKQASPTGKDMVQPAEYDAFGRQPKQFLPYAVDDDEGLFRTEASTEQGLFYQQTPDVAQDAFPFAEREYDASPLNRVLRQGGIGKHRSLASPYTVKSKTRTNTTGEVPMLHYDALSETCLFEGFYATGTLGVYETRDQHDRLSLAYTDADGRLLLKKSEAGPNAFASVLYVYDEFGLLRLSVQPEGVRQLQDNGWQPTPAILEEQCFRYEYDELGRLVVEKRPSSQPLWTVYDHNDRAVLVQDGNLRQKNQWQYAKVDGLGRTVLTGLYTDAVHLTRESLQAVLDAETVLSEQRSGENMAQQYGYTNLAFPRENTEVLTAAYYDDYDFDRDGTDDVAYLDDPDFTEPPTARLHGLATGSRVKLLGTTDMLLSAVFYDERGRPVQAQAEHHKNGRDVVWQAYAFTGEPTATKYRHCRKKEGDNWILNSEASDRLTSKARSTARRIKRRRGRQAEQYKILPLLETCREFSERYEYDKEGRLLRTFLRTDDGTPEVQTAAYAYNALGQPVRKDVHRTDTSVLQRVNFAYEITGALARINDPYLKDPDDLFGMELRYDEAVSPLQAEQRADGTISAMLWRSQRDTLTRGYGFRYDALGRLRAARYGADDGSGTWTFQNSYYDLDATDYDLNGNILELRNRGKVSDKEYGGYTDLLSYAYQGNRLAAVNDGIAKNMPQNDFRDNGVLGSLNDPEYLYDANGNRTQDKNKNQFTVYNFLNLPETITQEGYTVKYLRDASGRKLAKEVWKGNQLVHVRDYLGPFEYENDTLRRLHHGEGTVRYAYAPGKVTPHWQYRYTDHLGSVRMTYEAAAVQDTAYLCTMEEGKDEEGEYPKFKNVSATRDKVTAQEGDCSSLLIQQQGPLIGIPVRHGQAFDVSVWYVYEPIDVIVLPIQEGSNVILRKGETLTKNLEILPPPTKRGRQDDNRKKKPRFSFGITNQARLPQISPRKDKNFLPILNIISILDLPAKQQKGLPDLPPPNAGLRFVLTDTSDNVLHTEVKNVGPLGGSWLKLTHDYTTDLKKYGLDKGVLKIYVENEEQKLPVWFDSLYIVSKKTAAKIVQENHYTPFGNDIPDLAYYATSDSCDYLYNGSESDRITDALDYGWRQYDPQIGRWHAEDPLAELYDGFSPYNYALNNPVNYIDLFGMVPWDAFGNMPNGGQGQLLPRYREEEEDDGQNEHYIDRPAPLPYYAEQNDMWDEAGDEEETEAEHWADNLYAGYEYADCCPGDDDDDKKRKKERPDADGHLTLAEANDWYRNGNGQPLYVDLSKIDLMDVYASDVTKNKGYVNLFLKQSPLSQMMGGGGNVYGTIKLKLIGDRTVVTPKGYADRYDFDQKPWGFNLGTWLRNIGTYFGKQIAGEGTPYEIYFYGTGTLGVKTPLK